VKKAQSSGADLQVQIPWSLEDQQRIIDETITSGTNRIIAGGGDGTINAVVNALVGDGLTMPRASLGILPLGTANDFARGCGLPVEDLNRCLEIACFSPPRPTDVGRVNGRSFINVTSGGFGAEITATTPSEMKRRLGGMAYSIMGLVKAFGFQPYHGRLFIPGEDPVEGNMLLMAVGNGRFAGGGFDVARNARLDDGLLDLAVLRQEKTIRITELAAELKMPDNPDNQYLYYRQLAEFRIESDVDIHMNLDGEPMLARHFEFSVLPQHLGLAY